MSKTTSEIEQQLNLTLFNTSMNVPEAGIVFKETVSFSVEFDPAGEDTMRVTLYIRDSKSGYSWFVPLVKEIKMRSVAHSTRGLVQIISGAKDERSFPEKVSDEISSLSGFGFIFVSVRNMFALCLDVVIGSPSEYHQWEIVPTEKLRPFRKN